MCDVVMTLCILLTRERFQLWTAQVRLRAGRLVHSDYTKLDCATVIVEPSGRSTKDSKTGKKFEL